MRRCRTTAASTGRAICPATAATARSSPPWPPRCRPDAIWVTSHLRRTVETARAIHAADPLKFAGIEPTAVPDLAEQHLGDWQGLDRKAFYAERKVGTHAFWFAPADERPPGGESFADLVGRVAPAIERITQRARRPRHRRRDARRHHPRRAGPCLGARAAGRPRLRDRQLRAHAPRPPARRGGVRPVARRDWSTGGRRRARRRRARAASLLRQREKRARVPSPRRALSARTGRGTGGVAATGEGLSARRPSSGCNASGEIVKVTPR